MNIPNLDELISMALLEDVGDGDHSTLACIPPTATAKAKMMAKEDGILCGMEVGERVFEFVNNDFYHSQLAMKVTPLKHDGEPVKKGDILMLVEGASGVILTAERTALNFMQRMSGIATQTHKMVQMLDGLHTQLLDTRKTTPNMRLLEKYAVIDRTHNYLKEKGKDLKIEIEVRNLEELERVMQHGGVDRIMLDNFDPATLSKAVERIGGKYETEASGGITEATLRSYAETGVDFISVGALTHHIKSMDISLIKG